MRYTVVHESDASLVLVATAGSASSAIVSTFHNLLSDSQPGRMRQERAEAYASALQNNLNDDYIQDHSYAGKDIPRTAIVYRNEQIDELHTLLVSIGRAVGLPAGWGEGYRYLIERVEQLARFEREH